MRFDLSDEEWASIEPLLPPTRQGGERRNDRQVLNGIFYVLRTGIPWDDLPARYGPHTTAYNRFNRWAKQGIWQRLFEELASRHPASIEMIDSTSIKAHRAAAGAEKGGCAPRPAPMPKRSAARAAGAPPSSTPSSTSSAASGDSA